MYEDTIVCTDCKVQGMLRISKVCVYCLRNP